MFTLYSVLLALHVLAVAVWLGSGVFAFLLTRRLRGDDVARFDALTSGFTVLFPAAAGVAALSGVGLWIDGPWGFGEPWILIAVAGWVASAALAGGAGEAAYGRWLEGDEAGRATFLRISTIELGILTVVLADMVIKPFA